MTYRHVTNCCLRMKTINVKLCRKIDEMFKWFHTDVDRPCKICSSTTFVAEIAYTDCMMQIFKMAIPLRTPRWSPTEFIIDNPHMKIRDAHKYWHVGTFILAPTLREQSRHAVTCAQTLQTKLFARCRANSQFLLLHLSTQLIIPLRCL